MADLPPLRASEDAGARIAHGSELLPLVYDELRALARARLARLPRGQTLEATALVHEAYLRISPREPAGWHGRRHFFFAAARAIRDILVEDLRSKSRLKRGGEFRRVRLTELGAALSRDEDPYDLLALDEALHGLEADSPGAYEIVMLRYFAGLELAEAAETAGISESTAKRRWRYARAWLLRAMDGGGESTPSPDEGAP